MITGIPNRPSSICEEIYKEQNNESTHLLPDVIIEIFFRLGKLEFKRLSLTSKSWSMLASDSAFTKRIERNVRKEIYSAYKPPNYIGSYPILINQRLIMFSCFGSHRICDFREHKLLLASIPAGEILKKSPIFFSFSRKEIGILRGWNFQKKTMIFFSFSSSAKENSYLVLDATENFVITADLSASLKIWSINRCDTRVGNLENVITIKPGKNPSDSLVCHDKVILSDSRVAILKSDGVLSIWNFSKQLCSLKKDQVVQYGLASHNNLTNEWSFNFSFLGEKLIVLHPDSRLGVFDPETNEYREKLFEKSEKIVTTHLACLFPYLSEKFLSIIGKTLYIQDLNGEKMMFMELTFNVSAYYELDNRRLLFITEEAEMHLLDLINKNVYELKYNEKINFDKIDRAVFVDGCLVLFERCLLHKEQGFQPHVFNFVLPF